MFEQDEQNKEKETRRNSMDVILRCEYSLLELQKLIPGTLRLNPKADQIMEEKGDQDVVPLSGTIMVKPNEDLKWEFTASLPIENQSSFISIGQPLCGGDRTSLLVGRLLNDSLSNRNRVQKIGALTTREMEVIKLVASGFTSQQIAEQLFISLHTVNVHRKNIGRKLETNQMNDWIKIAQGLIS